jgi:N-terminal 7TM region of histidine kinase
MGYLGVLLASGLNLANQILSATVVLTAFSLLIYLLTHNFRSPVARAFCALLGSVLIVYAGDVVLYDAAASTVERWLKFQWVGIALAPAAYLHFSATVLRTTNLRSRGREIAVLVGYLISFGFLGLVFFTPWVVYDGVYVPQQSHLAAGPLFWAFAMYFLITVVWGAITIRRARQRCLTRASRRRMTYLELAFFGPGLGVFPYMLVTSLPQGLPSSPFLALLFAGNVSVLVMIVLLAYSVAYFGVLTPDRVVKHNLIHYLLRGPLVGAMVIFVMLTIPRVQRILGLPRDTVVIFAVVALIVFLQLAINRLKPLIDRVIYRQDREEVAWIQTLDRRLLTTADLSGFLENTLATLCDLLQVRTAFVAGRAGGEYRLEAGVGSRTVLERYLEQHNLSALTTAAGSEENGSGFMGGGGFWLAPLQSQTSDVRLGILGVQARAAIPDLKPEEEKLVSLLIGKAREAMEDRYLQQNVFDTLRRILPDIERLRRWRDVTRYAGSPPMEIIDDSPIYSPEFQQWVKDALSHYWGGPKLTESPLLGLRVVQAALHDHGGNPASALRQVLTQAAEALRPEGERKMTTSDWILYNILEMRFLRGMRVRDIAGRLAMSESDMYRKQRVAINQVAQVLADMELSEAALEKVPGSSKPGRRTDEGPRVG